MNIFSSGNRAFLKQHRFDAVILLLLFSVALLPRVLDLGQFITADEKNWIGRSYEFTRAFKDWRFNEMLQTTHPGVTALWMMGVMVTATIVVKGIPFSFQDLEHFVTVAQLPIAVTTSLLIALSYLLLRVLWPTNKLVALFAALFMALNPFLIAHSRVAHVDALLAGFLFNAALATILYARQGFSWKWLLVSAAMSGLSILTKAPAIFIVPFLLLVVLIYGAGEWRERSFWIKRLRDGVTWLLVIALMVLVIWPAVLFVPNSKGNAMIVQEDLSRAAITPHHMSSSYVLDGQFYLATLLVRSTPVVQVLLLFGVGWIAYAFWRKKLARDRVVDWRLLLLLLSYVVFFVVMMMLGAKKGDRYILPVFPMLDVLATLGLLLLFNLFEQARARTAGMVFVALAIGYSVLTVVSYHPYALAYSNPLFPDNLSQELGWGEGLELVGLWLDERETKPVVASWYPEELGVNTEASVAHINAHEQNKVQYIVLYKNMFGRAPDHPANDFIDRYYKKQDPVYVAEVAGREYAWVYEKPVYERIVGELVSGVTASQELVVSEYDNAKLIGLDLMIATYSGRATRGDVVVRATSLVDNTILQEWRIPVTSVNDAGWTTVRFDHELANVGSLLLTVQVDGSLEGNAPTLRYTSDNNYRNSVMQLSGAEKQGDLAVRFRYLKNGQEAIEEDTKLLRSR